MALRSELEFGPDDPRGVKIADVAGLLGVPMPTIRSWELRYGIPELSRGQGRHRRYSAAEVHALRLMRDEIARGHKASVAAATVLALTVRQSPADDLVRRILAQSQLMNGAAIRRLLDEARAALGLAASVDDVLLPALRQVGIWWAVGHCDDVQERLTTEAVRAWLDKASAFAPKPIHPHPVVLACGPSDLHTVGVESLALLLRFQGFPCRVLGARTPTNTVVTAARAAGAAAVVLVSHLATGRLRAVASIIGVHQLGIKIFYAGNAFSTARSRINVPGIYLGDRIGAACVTVVGELTDRQVVLPLVTPN